MSPHIPAGAFWDLDRAALLAVNGSWGPGWDTFWYLVSNPLCWGWLYVAILWLLWRRFGWRGMLVALGLMLLGLALADQTANFFKSHTPKFRPSRTEGVLWDGVPYNQWVHIVKGYTGGRFGTVSGHAATAMAISFTAAGIYRRWWFSLLVGFYVLMTCFSRMYLGVHFPMDILFGLTAGTLIGLLMVWLWKIINKRWKILRTSVT